MGKSEQTSAPAKSNVLIVDDHPILREGFSKIINQQPDLQVCGCADCARTALEAVRKLKPDLVILDISLEGANGLELIKSLLPLFPKSRILIFSMHNEMVYAERALRAGAKGYIMKQAPTEEVLRAIREILAGEIYVSKHLRGLIMQKFLGEKPTEEQFIERLSDRELEVFNLIGRGHKPGQIAKELNLSVKTIETYQAHLKRKIELKNSLELAGCAARWVNAQEQRPLV